MISKAAMPRFETDTVRRVTWAPAPTEDRRPKSRHQGAVPDLDHPREANAIAPDRHQENQRPHLALLRGDVRNGLVPDETGGRARS
ncbi:hypothetical protein VQ045_00430 [Aurantimonas sp. E1-2-R+4]|uniref:hypothetical protein n=1 Tax=Aurantimonas sp. E1-2-R+4 TaxID=3113714 RepID=UPI002F93AA62